MIADRVAATFGVSHGAHERYGLLRDLEGDTEPAARAAEKTDHGVAAIDGQIHTVARGEKLADARPLAEMAVERLCAGLGDRNKVGGDPAEIFAVEGRHSAVESGEI